MTASANTGGECEGKAAHRRLQVLQEVLHEHVLILGLARFGDAPQAKADDAYGRRARGDVLWLPLGRESFTEEGCGRVRQLGPGG